MESCLEIKGAAAENRKLKTAKRQSIRKINGSKTKGQIEKGTFFGRQFLVFFAQPTMLGQNRFYPTTPTLWSDPEGFLGNLLWHKEAKQ